MLSLQMPHCTPCNDLSIDLRDFAPGIPQEFCSVGAPGGGLPRRADAAPRGRASFCAPNTPRRLAAGGTYEALQTAENSRGSLSFLNVYLSVPASQWATLTFRPALGRFRCLR